MQNNYEQWLSELPEFYSIKTPPSPYKDPNYTPIEPSPESESESEPKPEPKLPPQPFVPSLPIKPTLPAQNIQPYNILDSVKIDENVKDDFFGYVENPDETKTETKAETDEPQKSKTKAIISALSIFLLFLAFILFSFAVDVLFSVPEGKQRLLEPDFFSRFLNRTFYIISYVFSFASITLFYILYRKNTRIIPKSPYFDAKGATPFSIVFKQRSSAAVVPLAIAVSAASWFLFTSLIWLFGLDIKFEQTNIYFVLAEFLNPTSPFVPVKSIFIMVITTVCLPISYELCFRGLIFNKLKNGFPFLASAIISSLLGAVVWLHPTCVVIYFIFGFFVAWIYHSSARLWVAIAANVAFSLSGAIVNYLNLKGVPIYKIFADKTGSLIAITFPSLVIVIAGTIVIKKITSATFINRE